MSNLERLIDWLRPVNRQISLVVAVWALVALTNLGTADLWDIDEGNNTEASREMRMANNWVVPTFNYELRVDKPALINWLQILSGLVFGEGEFAARFPSAIAGLFSLLAVWTIGQLWLGGLAGLAAALILAGSPMFVAAMRFANPDSLLTALVSWCMLFLLMGIRGARGVWWLYAAAACSALAMLGKGPIGLALPGAILLCTLLVAGGWKHIPWFHLPAALLLWLLIAGPWYIWVGTETKFAWHKGFFLQHNLGRFSAPMENHSGPIWYYLPVIISGTFPFSALLLLPITARQQPVASSCFNRLMDTGPTAGFFHQPHQASQLRSARIPGPSTLADIWHGRLEARLDKPASMACPNGYGHPYCGRPGNVCWTAGRSRRNPLGWDCRQNQPFGWLGMAGTGRIDPCRRWYCGATPSKTCAILLGHYHHNRTCLHHHLGCLERPNTQPAQGTQTLGRTNANRSCQA